MTLQDGAPSEPPVVTLKFYQRTKFKGAMRTKVEQLGIKEEDSPIHP